MMAVMRLLVRANYHCHCAIRCLNMSSLTKADNDRKIPATRDALDILRKMKPIQPVSPHLLKVSIIGPPNAGKSTLANELIGHRFSTVSKKVHTTRHNAIGVWTENNKQIVFLDTPGLTTPDKVKKHNLEKTLLTDPYCSLFNANLIMCVIDVSESWNRARLNHQVLTALMMHPSAKSVLIFNKVDLLKNKRDLLTTTRLLTDGIVGGIPIKFRTLQPKKRIDVLEKILEQEAAEERKKNSNIIDEEEDEMYKTDQDPAADEVLWTEKYFHRLRKVEKQAKDKKGWPNFDRVFMISALKNDGIEEIKDYLLESAQPGDWLYPDAMVTNQDPIEMVRMCVRSRLLDHLPQEIPYNIDIWVSHWEFDDNNVLRADINLRCKRRRDLISLMGPQGLTINKIEEETEQELINIFKHDIDLALTVQRPPE